MKSNRKSIVLSLIGLFLVFNTPDAYAREVQDKTGSPYFFIHSDDSETDRLPLKSTSADVRISGVIADVTVTQVYVNEGKRPIEAIYVFPASTRSAVYGMKMTVGSRTIIAKIKKKDEARQDYEQAKREGKSASLLEQQRPNVFQMNVSNILPKDRIVVELKYTELLTPRDKEYEFVYPTVVGPRYVSGQQSDTVAAENWTANPYLRQGEPPMYTFDISLQISTGLSIKDVACPSHKVNIEYKSPSNAIVRLDKTESSGGNRDFVCRYRLAGNKIESGLLLSEGEKENFFLLMVQPPERLKEQDIPPREYVFIVDVSGSMHGFPLDISKKLLTDLIGKLRPVDRFNVILFSGASQLMAEQSLSANSRNISKAIATIDSQQGGGGTELLPALNRALTLPGTDGYSRTFIMVTDGFVSVETEAFDLIRNSLGKANMFAFGIGSSVNRHLIEGIAHMGMGEPFIITSPEGASKTADTFRRLVSYPALTGIKVDYGRFNAYDMEPLSIPDLLSDRPLIVFGKWRGRPDGTIRVKGLTGRNVYMETIDVNKTSVSPSPSALRNLWARHRISLLSDYNRISVNDERIQQVTDLGLNYNLLTAYTSFVAIDSQVRLVNGKATTVRQPLPLPEGVSDLAVGESVSMKLCAPTAFFAERKVKDKKEYEQDELTMRGAINKGQVTLGSVIVSTGLNKDNVQEILEKTMPAIRECMSGKQMKKGKVVLVIQLDQKGRVSDIRTGRGYTGMKRCFLESLKAIRFQGSVGGKSSITCEVIIR